jgi:signal transduction histidine kinase
VVTVRTDLAEDETVVVQVRDEGCGLPDDAIDRVFDPFYTTKERGTGLGLAIVHRVVEAHGGTISARNRPEGGAEFTVRLPSAADASTREGTAERGPRAEASANAA